MVAGSGLRPPGPKNPRVTSAPKLGPNLSQQEPTVTRRMAPAPQAQARVMLVGLRV